MAKKKKPKAPLYSWNGGPKTHTISQVDHDQNVEAKGYGINLNAPTSAALTNRQTYGLAQQAADLEYGPQIQANQTMQRSVPEWYANYQASVAAQQSALKAYSDPLLQQAQAGVTNAGTLTAPGLDPNSPQYATDQAAAQGRQSIAQLGYDTLAAVPAAAQGYFGGQASIAARELPAVQAQYGQQLGQLKGQRGAAVAKNYGDLRGQEQNANIAYGTLGLNTDKAAADVDIARGVDPVTGDPLPQDAEKPVTSGAFAGMTPSEINGLSPTKRQEIRDKYNNRGAGAKAEEKEQREKEKAEKEKATKKAAIDKATGKLRTQVTDITDYQQNLVGQQGEDRSKKPDINGNYPTRTITQKDIDNAKVAKYGTLARISIAIRDGKALTKAQQDYIHQKDPNFRIPREWIKGRPVAARPPTAPSGPGSTEQRPT